MKNMKSEKHFFFFLLFVSLISRVDSLSAVIVMHSTRLADLDAFQWAGLAFFLLYFESVPCQNNGRQSPPFYALRLETMHSQL